MGAKKTKRISVRVAEAGDDYIRLEAQYADITPSHMTRRMLAYAREHMPRGWVPARGTGQRRSDRKGA